MLKPLAEHVIVEVVAKEEKTASGIFLPDTAAKEKPQTGHVLAVGLGKLLDNGTRVEPEVKAGDEVVFAKYSGTEMKLNGKDYLILNQRDILAVIEE
ncbi:MAG: co-chaperone GroES [Phascolarctobacterium sp.]|nr:co-chaperone GroES [Phascolarctobacterium sp.]MBQ7760293.1 co-chaperone GroES [Acidaminococcaceae bacterium]MBQ7884338.1 co-chaperone GroES [Phascolarctobacterium sp.]